MAFYLDRRGKQTDACECPMAAAASVHSFIAYCNLEALFRSVHLLGPVPAFWLRNPCTRTG